MGYSQVLSAYRETGVKTASQGKLIIMLYDEAVKQLGMAVSWFDSDLKADPHKIELANQNILKTQEIITELMASLDMEAGGEIARNLFSLYVYFNHELLEGNISKDRGKIASVRDLMDQLRLTWHEVVNSTPVQAQMSMPAGLNITG
ncbi:MAG: flagellar export chaperone FliS [Spirochaetaceae bacterium]|jgi:flagellar protein FliS|nr:flagellar export chaperone FliS [Spirochaetaceae bacterium]